MIITRILKSIYMASTLALTMIYSFGVSADASKLEFHDGIWVTTVPEEGLPGSVTHINDVRVDSANNAIAVYVQTRYQGEVFAPAQVGPGECGTVAGGIPACFHPNAVYLNGSGVELTEADGKGEWWIKHAWVNGGEGFENCEAIPLENYDRCFWVEGDLMDDGLSIRIGGLKEGQGYNVRTPLLQEDPISYQLTRYGPVNLNPDAGEVDLTLRKQWTLIWQCEEITSALDGKARKCPTEK